MVPEGGEVAGQQGNNIIITGGAYSGLTCESNSVGVKEKKYKYVNLNACCD